VAQFTISSVNESISIASWSAVIISFSRLLKMFVHLSLAVLSYRVPIWCAYPISCN